MEPKNSRADNNIFNHYAKRPATKLEKYLFGNKKNLETYFAVFITNTVDQFEDKIARFQPNGTLYLKK